MPKLAAHTASLTTSENRPSERRGYRFELFLQSNSEEAILWSGRRTSFEQAISIYGADEVIFDVFPTLMY